MNRKIEILAPAGNKESFMAAINNNADAVYIGLKKFSARNKADNFEIEKLKEYVDYAHLRNVKVYLTINTLLKNSELSELIDSVKNAIDAHVDAFIVQDLGVINILTNCFKGIVLHASTQLGIHNKEGAIIAEKLGIKRVILARETTLEDIKEIRQNTSLEIECFVQGAMCVAFSGNCYYSSLCNKMSGNRGECQQPCRLKYSADLQGEAVLNGYLLSATDLCLIDKMKELINAGVCSFKIEGRLRRSGYVAQAVNSYRKILNLFESDDSYETKYAKEIEKEKANLKKSFFRGEYNNGNYLTNDITEKTINAKYQNHRGVLIGKVVNVVRFKDLNKVTIYTKSYKINAGDGLKFVADNFEGSMGAGNVEKIDDSHLVVYTKNKVINSCDVYLTLERKREEYLLSIQKKLDIDMRFVANKYEKARLVLTYKNIEVFVESEDVLEKSKTINLTEDDLLLSLDRFVDTPFVLKKSILQFDDIFISKAELNKLRRTAEKLLEERILSEYESFNIQTVEFDDGYYKKYNNDIPLFKNANYVIVSENNAEKVSESNVIIAPTIYNESIIKNLLEKYSDKIVYLYLPTLLNFYDKKVIEDILIGLDKDKVGLAIDNIYGFYYAQQGFKIITLYKINVSNNFCERVLKQFDVLDFTKSIENYLFYETSNGLAYNGYPALMTLSHCPYKTCYKFDNCKNCKFNGRKLSYTAEDGKQFTVRRTRVANCKFELIGPTKINVTSAQMVDLREN